MTVWAADDVIVFNRFMAPGYAGAKNLYSSSTTLRCFLGDAKDRVEDILRAL